MVRRERSSQAARVLQGLLLALVLRGPAGAAQTPPEGAADSAPAVTPVVPRPSTPAAKARPRAGFVVPEAVRRARTEDPPGASPGLFALAAPEVLEALGAWRPVVGAWVEYEVRQQGHAPALVRLSVLPPALPAGRFWVEIAAGSPESVPVAARLLVHGPPTHPENVERTLLYIAGQSVLELPLDETDGSFQPLPKGLGGLSIKKLGHEQVKVRGGTFEAQRLQVTREQQRAVLWRADSVPLLGLVKSSDARSTTELIGLGLTGAHTVFPANQDPEGASADYGNGSDSRK